MQQQERALLAAILGTAVDAIIVIDERGIIQIVNDATTTMFGYQKQEMVGNNVKMLMPAPYREEHDGYLRRYEETGVAKIIGVGREVVGCRQDGSTFPMHLAVSEVPAGDRKLFAGIVRDISDLKEAQEELKISNEQLEQRVRERTKELRAAQADLVRAEKLSTLGRVSGGIAHEIRNPLNVVRTSTYFLQHAKQPSEEKVAEHLGRIERQVSLIDNVVSALADIARMPQPHTKPCDVPPLVHSVVASVTLDNNVQVIEEFPEDLPPVSIDPDQISIVLRNLIRNARDAMPDGGTITLSAELVEEQVVIQICDTGTGIHPDDLQKISEPLFTTKARGMGLGLAISAAILEKHRSEWKVNSEMGKGTCFRFGLQIQR